jgi:hypothetical protein
MAPSCDGLPCSCRCGQGLHTHTHTHSGSAGSALVWLSVLICPCGRPAQMHLRSARGVFPRLSLLASDEHGAMWTSKWTPEIRIGAVLLVCSYRVGLPRPVHPHEHTRRPSLSRSLSLSLWLSLSLSLAPSPPSTTHRVPSASHARSLLRRRPCCYRKFPLSYTRFRYPARSSSDPGTAIEHWRTLHQPQQAEQAQQPVRSTTPALPHSRRLHLPLHTFADYYFPSRSCPLSAAFAVPVSRPPPSPLLCCSAAPLPCARHPLVNSRPAPHALLL